MAVKNEKFVISTKGFDDVIDITQKIQNSISNDIKEGLVNIISEPSTSLLVVEEEKSFSLDIANMMSGIIPINKLYEHDSNSIEGNTHAHLKSLLLGNKLNLPIIQGALAIPKHNRIIMIDFDNKANTREVVATTIY